MRCPCCATHSFYRTRRPSRPESTLARLLTVWIRCRRCGCLRRVLRLRALLIDDKPPVRPGERQAPLQDLDRPKAA